MRLGFVVNDVMTEQAVYTTTRLALTAHRAGHEVWTMGVGDLAYDPDESVRATARRARSSKPRSLEAFLGELQSDRAVVERISVDELDVLLLRNDPAADSEARPWAQMPAVLFGQIAARHGVTVLNDPAALARAANKLYLQEFPEQIRPRTMITHRREDVLRFFAEKERDIVLKPLQGSGGHNVFLLRRSDSANANQIIETVLREGYVVAQEYLRAAAEGDTRLLMLNGVPLQRDGKYAAIRRMAENGDLRSNMHAGGRCEAAVVDDVILRLADLVRPKLVQDGMFFVGLDIAGEKVMEINIFSPGGLGSVEAVTGSDFSIDVLNAIERKVDYKRTAAESIDNASLATL